MKSNFEIDMEFYNNQFIYDIGSIVRYNVKENIFEGIIVDEEKHFWNILCNNGKIDKVEKCNIHGNVFYIKKFEDRINN